METAGAGEPDRAGRDGVLGRADTGHRRSPGEAVRGCSGRAEWDGVLGRADKVTGGHRVEPLDATEAGQSGTGCWRTSETRTKTPRQI